MDPVREVAGLMARQHGVVSRSQVFSLGMSRAQIQHRLQVGTWTLLCSGVYAAASSIPTWERQLRAALLSHPLSVVAGRAAAVLHGFDGLRRSRPEILMPFEGNARSSIARVIRSRHFNRIATTMALGFPVTTVAETILTLSLRESQPTLERIVDSELARGRLRIEDFDPILERLEHARQRGLPMLKRVIRERGDGFYQPPSTDLERLLYRLLDLPELPSYIRQLPIDYEHLEATVDAYIPQWRLIVEADGRRWHTRKADFERDRQRDNAAASAGLLVVRFTYSMLRSDPDGCLHTLLSSGRWRQSA